MSSPGPSQSFSIAAAGAVRIVVLKEMPDGSIVVEAKAFDGGTCGPAQIRRVLDAAQAKLWVP